MSRVLADVAPPLYEDPEFLMPAAGVAAVVGLVALIVALILLVRRSRR